MHLDDMLPDTMRVRLDANECRVLLRRGPAEDVVALGWHLDDHATFDEIARRVARHGVPSTEGRSTAVKLKFSFLRVNERHHSVAIASVNALPINPIRTRAQHASVSAPRSTTW